MEQAFLSLKKEAGAGVDIGPAAIHAICSTTSPSLEINHLKSDAFFSGSGQDSS
jgi:hypothetical protein